MEVSDKGLETSLAKSNISDFQSYFYENNQKLVRQAGVAFYVNDHTDTMDHNQYPLKNSAILNSRSTDHVFNEIAHFLNYCTAPDHNFLWGGDLKVPIQGYGDMDMQIKTPQGSKVMHLFNVTHCERFATNLVSLHCLLPIRYSWNVKLSDNILRKGQMPVPYIEDQHRQFVLEYIPLSGAGMCWAFFTRRNLYNLWTK